MLRGDGGEARGDLHALALGAVRREEHLGERAIGQSEAVTAVAAAIRRARAGMKDPRRPVGSFLFLASGS